MTHQYIQNKSVTDEANKKRNEILSFVVSSCIKAEKLGISLKQHIHDAEEFLTPFKTMMDCDEKNKLDYITYIQKCHEHNVNDVEDYINFRKDAFIKNENNKTASSNFKNLNIKFANEIRDEDYSLVKKIISIYSINNNEDMGYNNEDIGYTELKFLSGFLEKYITTGLECEYS